MHFMLVAKTLIFKHIIIFLIKYNNREFIIPTYEKLLKKAFNIKFILVGLWETDTRKSYS